MENNWNELRNLEEKFMLENFDESDDIFRGNTNIVENSNKKKSREIWEVLTF